jgi:hypothetical protein
MTRAPFPIGLTIALLLLGVPAVGSAAIGRDATAATALQYWTPERMREAELRAGAAATAPTAQRPWRAFPAEAGLVQDDNVGVRTIGFRTRRPTSSTACGCCGPTRCAGRASSARSSFPTARISPTRTAAARSPGAWRSRASTRPADRCSRRHRARAQRAFAARLPSAAGAMIGCDRQRSMAGFW